MDLESAELSERRGLFGIRPLPGILAVAASVVAAILTVRSSRAMPERFQAEGNRLRMCVSGTAPVTVIFDTFGGAPLEFWNEIQLRVARFAGPVSFDHGGYWGSEPGAKPRHARQLSTELHAALASAGIPP